MTQIQVSVWGGAYTTDIKIPQYEIKGEPQTFDKMLDETKSTKLISEIEKSGVSQEEKNFLIEAAKRHNKFNYRNIAEYYAQASAEMQSLMEHSALVILDVDDAIANGYASLLSNVKGIMEGNDE